MPSDSAASNFTICAGTHSTLLLDRGVPVHVVAERKQTADTSMVPVINATTSDNSKT